MSGQITLPLILKLFKAVGKKYLR